MAVNKAAPVLGPLCVLPSLRVPNTGSQRRGQGAKPLTVGPDRFPQGYLRPHVD